MAHAQRSSSEYNPRDSFSSASHHSYASSRASSTRTSHSSYTEEYIRNMKESIGRLKLNDIQSTSRTPGSAGSQEDGDMFELMYARHTESQQAEPRVAGAAKGGPVPSPARVSSRIASHPAQSSPLAESAPVLRTPPLGASPHTAAAPLPSTATSASAAPTNSTQLESEDASSLESSCFVFPHPPTGLPTAIVDKRRGAALLDMTNHSGGATLRPQASHGSLRDSVAQASADLAGKAPAELAARSREPPLRLSPVILSLMLDDEPQGFPGIDTVETVLPRARNVSGESAASGDSVATATFATTSHGTGHRTVTAGSPVSHGSPHDARTVSAASVWSPPTGQATAHSRTPSNASSITTPWTAALQGTGVMVTRTVTSTAPSRETGILVSRTVVTTSGTSATPRARSMTASTTGSGSPAMPRSTDSPRSSIFDASDPGSPAAMSPVAHYASSIHITSSPSPARAGLPVTPSASTSTLTSPPPQRELFAYAQSITKFCPITASERATLQWAYTALFSSDSSRDTVQLVMYKSFVELETVRNAWNKTHSMKNCEVQSEVSPSLSRVQEKFMRRDVLVHWLADIFEFDDNEITWLKLDAYCQLILECIPRDSPSEFDCAIFSIILDSIKTALMHVLDQVAPDGLAVAREALDGALQKLMMVQHSLLMRNWRNGSHYKAHRGMRSRPLKHQHGDLRLDEKSCVNMLFI